MKKNSSLPKPILKIISEAQKRSVQICLASPTKLRLVGPADAVERIKPSILEHKAAILEHLQSDPWSWHAAPNDPDDKDAIEWWMTIEHLREILTYEGWALDRIGKALIVKAEPCFTPAKLQRLHVAVDGLRACWPVLVHRVEFFPLLTVSEAQGLLERIERCHRQDGFRVKGWHGLEYPLTWPLSWVAQLFSIYCQSLQTDGGLQ